MPKPAKLNIAVAEREPEIHPEPISAINDDAIVANDLERRVSKLYSYIEPENTRRFLLSHYEVLEVLIQAMPVIQNIFGDGTTAHLLPVSDDEGTILVAAIHSRYSFEESMALFKSFELNWWMKQTALQRSPFIFDVDIEE